VSDRREKRLLRGGLLIGFGVGLCIGVALMFTAVGFLLTGPSWDFNGRGCWFSLLRR